MSIVDPKYRQRMKDSPDWLRDRLKEQTETKTDYTTKRTNPDTKVVEEVTKTKKGPVNTERLYEIAAANGVDLTEFRKTDPNPGRVSMTVSNHLRSIVKKRHGLFLLDAKRGQPVWTPAPEEYLTEKLKVDVSAGPTQKRNGDPIKKAKPKKGEAEAEAPASETAEAE